MNKLAKRLVLASAALTMATTPALAEEVAAPLTTKSGTIGQPPQGKGQIVFFRPGSFIGAALGCTVNEKDGEIARLGSGKYYVVTAEPGTHEYFTKGEATDKLTIEVEGDETYFVRCNIGMGVMAGRANLSPSDRATFAGNAKSLAMWKASKDEGGAAKD